MSSIHPAIQSTIRLLKRLPLLADVPESSLEFLAQHTRVEHYKLDAVIFYQGDRSERIWLVRQGQVKIVYHDEKGREVILEIISVGEAFGGGVLFFPIHPATAKAMENSTLISFSSEIYTQFLIENPSVSVKLVRMLGARHLSMINMQILAGERVERRMAHILFKLASRLGRSEEDGMVITIPLSRQDLADMACTTLESAIRTISRFRKDNILFTRRGGYIVILDMEELENLTH